MISKSAKTELRACLLIFAHEDQGVANVDLLARRLQYTTVTTIGKQIIVEKRSEWASWKGRYHRSSGEEPVRLYTRVCPAAKRK
jgi:hypothetical protein